MKKRNGNFLSNFLRRKLTETVNEPLNGVTLRDYFAAQAMQGLIVNGHTYGDSANDKIGRYSYSVADAMLEWRNR